MATAKKKNPTPTPTPTPASIAASAAGKDTDSILSTLTAENIAEIRLTAETFGGIAQAEWRIALAVKALKKKNLHVSGKSSDFATWFERVTEALGCKVSRSTANRYTQAAEALEACEVNAERFTQAQGLSVDVLSRLAGKAKKAGLKGDARASKVRTDVKEYTAHLSAGKTHAQAQEAVGIGKGSTGASATALDYDGKVGRLVSEALRLNADNYAEALAMVAKVKEVLERKQQTAANVAAGIGS